MRNNNQLGFEALEVRKMMAADIDLDGGELFIEGTDDSEPATRIE